MNCNDCSGFLPHGCTCDGPFARSPSTGSEASGSAIPARPTLPGEGDGLIARIDAAIKRIVDGQACMRIPAEQTDPDLVLAECKRALLAGGDQKALPPSSVQAVDGDEPVAWLCCGSLFHSYAAIPSELLPPNGSPVPLYIRAAMKEQGQ